MGIRQLRITLKLGPLSNILLTILLFFSVVWLFHINRLENKNRYTLAEDFGTNVLKCLPKNSLLLADGDHYVMPIWYEKIVNQKRKDVIFEPSVFLYHGWGWKQLVDQSEDLRPFVFDSNLFQERLKALTQTNSNHPLFYCLGGDTWNHL